MALARFQRQGELLKNVLRALSELPVRGLVTLGPAFSPAEIPSADNVVVVRSAPHQLLLPEAAVLVTHGGHGTTIKGAVQGVPMLCIPLGRDQADNTVRVTTRGAGLALKSTASTAALKKALARLLDEPQFRSNARALANSIRASERDADAISLLEGLFEGSPSRVASVPNVA